jgi:predicted dehydrogenase
MANTASSAKVLRVAVIGAGGIAGTHMNYLSKMADVKLVAASDVREESLAKVKEQFKLEATYTDWNELLKRGDIDAVSVCTPNGLHKQPSIDALNAGCHVLVEKPIAMNATEGEEMLAAAKKNGKQLVIGFQWRFHQTAQMIKRAADEGMFGKILFVRSQALRRRGIPNWGVFGRKDLQGGGPMIDIGVHNMEMCHYIMGSPKPVAASGKIHTYLGDKPSNIESSWPNWDWKSYTVEDLAVGHITFENGAVMHVEASFAMHGKDVWNFTMMGEKGGCQFDPPQLFRDEAGTMYDMTPAFQPKRDMFEIKMRAFVDTALYGKPSPAPAEHGVMVQKMIDGIYASSAAGREVTIA